MKQNKSILLSFFLLVLVAAIYRIIPGRPYGFAPQWSMAVFAGAVIKDRKWAFAVPVLSMMLSDILFQLLYSLHLTELQGFYEGQWQNYLLFGLMSVCGWLVTRMQVGKILMASLIAPTAYFLLSNFLVWSGWSGTRGLGRPRTWNGLLLCYNDAVPFYKTSILASVVFSALLFGSYYLISRKNKSLAGSFHA
jgi:hypothetical protein